MEVIENAKEITEAHKDGYKGCSAREERYARLISELLEIAQAQGWKPIADAPKDKRVILRNEEFFAYYGELQSENRKWCRGIMLVPEPTHYMDISIPTQEKET